MDKRNKEFKIGDRVLVSSSGGWKQDSFGSVCGGPEVAPTITPLDYYWVVFDQPQECIYGDDKYYKAQILSIYLSSVS
jgi:hypothetical protein